MPRKNEDLWNSESTTFRRLRHQMLKSEDDRRNSNEIVVRFKFNPVRHARKLD